MKEFEGKVALVTGGGSGIGRATAVAFAREGAQVVIGNRNVERGEETVSMVREAGGTASFQRTDVLLAAINEPAPGPIGSRSILLWFAGSRRSEGTTWSGLKRRLVPSQR